MYNYKTVSTEGSSHQYGSCDICKKHCAEVFYQIESKNYINPVTKKPSTTYHGCKNYFGHKECIESRQRKHEE